MVGFGGGLPSGGKEAAEKGMLSDKMTGEHPAGAKQVAEKVGAGQENRRSLRFFSEYSRRL